MSLPKSLLAYEPQLQFMEKAMDEVRGARMWFHRENEAEHFRMRCNYARQLHREENMKVHEPGTTMHGKSEYDPLMFTIRHSQDGVWCYAEKQILDLSRVEAIPENDYVTIDATQINLIEDQTDDDQTAA